ncbi:uncharacterized protein LOC116414957 [Apis florea]|uniref:uncharacterized protein LOC116414957 n=1 Tax=Apis florea TaxID=7463 RepID=UPI0012FF39AC|nr:uncharacterized protein LOC116414957 [Apis florea]
MFSELCRETLRKAAVCYSSGRAGSPSPSPPTSPPPSPAKEAKATANVDLANVRDACHEARDPGTSGKRTVPHQQQPTSSGTEFRDFTAAGRRSATASTDSREYVYAAETLPSLEAFNGGRRLREKIGLGRGEGREARLVSGRHEGRTIGVPRKGTTVRRQQGVKRRIRVWPTRLETR